MVDAGGLNPPDLWVMRVRLPLRVPLVDRPFRNTVGGIVVVTGNEKG
jgi:hypothetical protein